MSFVSSNSFCSSSEEKSVSEPMYSCRDDPVTFVYRRFPVVDDPSTYNREVFLKRRQTMSVLLDELWRESQIEDLKKENVRSSKIVRKNWRDVKSMSDADFQKRSINKKSLWKRFRRAITHLFLWKSSKINPECEPEKEDEKLDSINVENKSKGPVLRHANGFVPECNNRPQPIFGNAPVVADFEKSSILSNKSDCDSSVHSSTSLKSSEFLNQIGSADSNVVKDKPNIYINANLTESFVNLTPTSAEYIDHGDESFQLDTERLNKKRFYEVCLELVSTEESFIDDMKIVIDLFYRPFLEKKWMKEKDANTIFSNLVQILPVNQLFYKALRENFYDNGIFGIGDIFLSMAEYFKIYTIYCSSHGLALNTLNKCLSKSESMKIYTKELYKQPEFRGLDLQSFLLKPIQRICKYPLFLKELLKFSQDSNEREGLEIAHGKIQSIVNTVNQKSQEAIEVQRTVDALSNIKFQKSFILESRSRRLILENSFLFSITENMHPSSMRRFYLFSDVIIVAKSVPFSKGKFSCCLKISLMDGVSISDKEMSHPYGGLYCLKLSVEKTGKVFFLYSEDAKKLYKWQEEIEKLISS